MPSNDTIRICISNNNNNLYFNSGSYHFFNLRSDISKKCEVILRCKIHGEIEYIYHTTTLFEPYHPTSPTDHSNYVHIRVCSVISDFMSQYRHIVICPCATVYVSYCYVGVDVSLTYVTHISSMTTDEPFHLYQMISDLTPVLIIQLFHYVMNDDSKSSITQY